MPANWISDRPSVRRMPRPLQAPRLELPVPQPVFEPAPSADQGERGEQAKRGSVVVDFYI